VRSAVPHGAAHRYLTLSSAASAVTWGRLYPNPPPDYTGMQGPEDLCSKGRRLPSLLVWDGLTLLADLDNDQCGSGSAANRSARSGDAVTTPPPGSPSCGSSGLCLLLRAHATRVTSRPQAFAVDEGTASEASCAAQAIGVIPDMVNAASIISGVSPGNSSRALGRTA
jgi:hypothetical protein